MLVSKSQLALRLDRLQGLRINLCMVLTVRDKIPVMIPVLIVSAT